MIDLYKIQNFKNVGDTFLQFFVKLIVLLVPIKKCVGIGGPSECYIVKF